MKTKCHLLIFYGIYRFFAFLAFEIQRPKRPKLISMKSEQTLFYIILFICSETALLKWLPGGQTNFYFLYG